MSFNRVDLSLDDIIKMDRQKQPEHNRGGNNRQQGHSHNKGQGQQGQRNMGKRLGPGVVGKTGVSPLNRGKTNFQTGAGVSATSSRGHVTGMRNQKVNHHGWTGNRGNKGNRGNVHRDANSGPGGGGFVRRANAGHLGGAAGGAVGPQNRGYQGNQRGTQGNLQGSFQKRTNMTGQGSVMKRVGQGQNQGQVGPKQLSIDQKRLNAIKALQEARKTIAQLDQQAARQNSFNARRGLPVQDRPLMNKNKGMYSSSNSLASTTSRMSSASGRQMKGTRITSFSVSDSPQDGPGQRRWHTKPTGVNLTISIDNSRPIPDHLTPVSSPDIDDPYEDAASTLHHHRGHRRFSPDVDDPYEESISTLHHNRKHRCSPDIDDPYVKSASMLHHHRKHRMQRDGDGDRRHDDLDLRRGATPGFARQLAQLKPTKSVKYMFQKKTFSSSSTPFSLNDRFSTPASEDPLGRKVFM